MNKNKKEDFLKAQQKLDRKKPLCFCKSFKCKDKNYQDFISNLLSKYRLNKNTYYLMNKKTQERKLFCDTFRKRSLTDIYKLTKFYFPDVTLEQCKQQLLDLEKTEKLSGSWCSTVKRMVYTYNPTNPYTVKVNRRTEVDELGIKI